MILVQKGLGKRRNDDYASKMDKQISLVTSFPVSKKILLEAKCRSSFIR